MPSPNAQSALKIVTQDAFDPELLTTALNQVTTNPVVVSQDSVTFDEADRGAVESTLATIGIETAPAEAPVVSASAAVNASAPAAVNANDTPAAQVPAAPAADPMLNVEAKISAAKSWQGVLCNANSLEASWLLIAGDAPVARVRLAAIKGHAQLAGLFSTGRYFENLQASFTKNGIAATLSSVNAEICTEETVQMPEPVDVEAIKAATIEKFRKCLSVAVLASNKNVIQNRLKAGAYKVLAEQGVPDPEAVVEAIFAEAEGFLDDVVNQADAYSQEDESSFQTTAKLLASLSVQSGAGRKPLTAAATQMRASLTQGNFPLTGAVGDPLRDPAQEWDQNADPIGVLDPITPAPLTAAEQETRSLFAAAVQPKY